MLLNILNKNKMNFASFDFPEYLVRNNFYLIRTHDGDLVRRLHNGKMQKKIYWFTINKNKF